MRDEELRRRPTPTMAVVKTTSGQKKRTDTRDTYALRKLNGKLQHYFSQARADISRLRGVGKYNPKRKDRSYDRHLSVKITRVCEDGDKDDDVYEYQDLHPSVVNHFIIDAFNDRVDFEVALANRLRKDANLSTFTRDEALSGVFESSKKKSTPVASDMEQFHDQRPDYTSMKL